ncbi:hypothetical protein EKO04_007891 [Ascochyta lentis]|uniref:Extracellular mutant protein 11 C-terminal domain-containing protein n=1 Tax=Ascochyta lentis TaxID=205686 RepID=A0A8H7IWV8_9PLEO|nr:hypothetical protein EKO04_007891 [Ascochyta lentis]
MQGFVKTRNGQADTPLNGPGPVNPSRQAIAANAKVHVTRPAVSQTSIAQHGLPLRGESVNQQGPASLPHNPQRRPSGEGRKRDLYDTDAESLDSTANRSVMRVENSPQVDQQQLQLDNEDAESGGDDEASSEYEEDGVEYQFDELAKEYLQHHGKGNSSYDEQVKFLQKTQPQLFHMIEGDSYPTTTEGDITESGERQETHFEDLGSPSPSPQHPIQQGPSAALFNQQPLQQRPVPNLTHINPAGPHNSRIYKKGEEIRGQQRTDGARGQPDQQHNRVPPPASQPPTYSQANREQCFSTFTHVPQGLTVVAGQAELRQQAPNLPSGPGSIQTLLPRITEPTAPSKHASTIRAKVVPTIQQHTEPTPVEAVEQPLASPNDDYKSEILFRLDYDQLAKESFDKDPRARELVLSGDMLEKPLAERLLFAYRSLDPAAQSEFFSTLPTNEWEDAGDWFLDEFSKIIKETKDARQKKRNAARAFEAEIEKRHTQVAKKQKLVEGAMIKMKTQGEGLVPKSPRASKSPRPRRI